MRARQAAASAIISTAGLFSAPAQSQDLQAQQQALAQIIKTANEICQSAPLEETSRGINLKGDANAKLGGLVGKLADLGVSGAGEYQTNRSMGVLQKDLITAIQSANGCKLEVFRTLEEDLLRGRALTVAPQDSANLGADIGKPTAPSDPPSVAPVPQSSPNTHPVLLRPRWCDRAGTQIETAICQNSDLADLDVRMDGAYNAVLSRLAPDSEQYKNFKREQYSWFVHRNDCQQSSNVVACLKAAYSSRIGALAAAVN